MSLKKTPGLRTLNRNCTNKIKLFRKSYKYASCQKSLFIRIFLRYTTKQAVLYEKSIFHQTIILHPSSKTTMTEIHHHHNYTFFIGPSALVITTTDTLGSLPHLNSEDPLTSRVHQYARVSLSKQNPASSNLFQSVFNLNSPQILAACAISA